MPRRISLHAVRADTENKGNRKKYDNLSERTAFFYDNLERWIIRRSSAGIQDNNAYIPAGYTYLGQFIAHDLTLHLRSSLPLRPSMSLAGIYGGGPGVNPALYTYELVGDQARYNGILFDLEEVLIPLDATMLNRNTLDRFERQEVDLANMDPLLIYDLPRKTNETAAGEDALHLPIMGDARNDENFILSQLQVLFMRAHNKKVKELYEKQQSDYDSSNDKKDSPNPAMIFRKAQRWLVAQYHHLIIQDYLPRMTGVSFDESKPFSFIFKAALAQEESPTGLPHPDVLSIFSSAMMRIGHSQVRDQYILHPYLKKFGLFAQREGANDSSLDGFYRSTKRAIDWALFFGDSTTEDLNQSQVVNLILSPLLFNLPYPNDNEPSLVKRNLKASVGVELGWFLEQWENSHLATPLLSIDQFVEILSNRFNWPENLKIEEIPAWIYFLAEAEILGQQGSLGPLGSRIFTEFLHWTIKNNRVAEVDPEELYSSMNELVTYATNP